MEIERLIAALSRPEAYPHTVDNVLVHQTHISAVFLAGDFAYKVKKPVRFSFLDFSTLEKRKHFCEEEVRLNRRLAPDVYLGVVPITETGGRIEVGGEGEIIEWAVKMQRLPDEATLESMLERGEVDEELISRLGRRLAEFHAAAESNDRIAEYGRYDQVARNMIENFTETESHIGHTVAAEVHARLKELTLTALARHRDLIEQRARGGMIRDTHGDLHLDHVYLLPGESGKRRLVIVDCIEFNERFRYSDPVADMAFLYMDLAYHGRRDLAERFAGAYFEASGDADGRKLLSLYIAYRALVRAKVEGMELMEKEIPEAGKPGIIDRARGHWLLALGELEMPDRRPCLILVGGLPGTGKSTLARKLAEVSHFVIIRSDEVRKELAGVPAKSRLPSNFYSPLWNDRTYSECLRRAESALFRGKRVIVDATFRSESRRRPFFALARRYCVPLLFIVCTAPDDIIRTRLFERRGDVSDADWQVYQDLAACWEKPEIAASIAVDTSQPGAIELVKRRLSEARLV